MERCSEVCSDWNQFEVGFWIGGSKFGALREFFRLKNTIFWGKRLYCVKV